MEYASYFRELADYYNRSRIHDKKMTGAAAIRAEFEKEGSWVRTCAKDLQAVLANRRVIEVVCGGGRWTQFIADVAEKVVATDCSPQLLERARLLKLPDTEFVECDAFSLDRIPKTFTGACHINFMNHVPLALLPNFIDRVHQMLEPGSVVFCATQRDRGSPKEPWYEKRETGDMVTLRHCEDGTPVEVVDTLFTEDLLRGLFAGKARRLQISMKSWWWWASYEIA
jgi:2-polyprenyl-3-methyl-5-hydroxy-6-metoxy-1,4-benzoquinol methylase